MSEQNKALTQDQVIVASCTPPGRGAIALIRVSGPGAVELVDSCSKVFGKTNLSGAKSHTIHYGEVLGHKKGHVIDLVLFLMTRAPRTFTGEDTVEITCHGNPMIVEQIIGRIISAGARLAQRGEFSRRSFLNGKLDLVQAEAIHELVMSGTQLSLDQSMRKLRAGLSTHIENLENLAIDLISTLEASFEFLEEEERDIDFPAMVRQRFDDLMQQCKTLRRSCADQSKIAQGVKVAILGTPNAGKSTLFNALLGQSRAIVSDVAGTTRDSIESLAMREGQLWSLVDTAGIRKTSDSIEKEGIARAMDQAAQADVIIFTFDPAGEVDSQVKLFERLKSDFAQKIIAIFAKSDLNSDETREISEKIEFQIRVSAKAGQGLEELEKIVAQKIQTLFDQHASNFALTERQRILVEQFFGHLEAFDEKLKAEEPIELLAVDLREAVKSLTELTGKNVEDKILSQVFANFCVGK